MAGAAHEGKRLRESQTWRETQGRTHWWRSLKDASQEVSADGVEGEAPADGAEATAKDGDAAKKDDKGKDANPDKKPEEKKPAEKK